MEISNDFISIYNFIFNDSSSGQLDAEIQNAFKLSRLILDVLNLVLQDWIQNNYNNYKPAIWDDILKINNPHLNNVKEIITNCDNNHQNRPDFKLFGHFLRRYLAFCKMWNLFWQKIKRIGKFVSVNCKKIEKII